MRTTELETRVEQAFRATLRAATALTDAGREQDAIAAYEALEQLWEVGERLARGRGLRTRPIRPVK